MKANGLALLDRAVEGAVSHELGEAADPAVLAELGIVPRRSRAIAGLTVISNAARDKEIDPEAAALFAKLRTFRVDALSLRSTLTSHNVQPLAVLPLTAWDSLCEKSGLFRFIPQDDEVRVDAANTGIVTEAQKYVEGRAWRHTWLPIILWTAVCAVAYIAMIATGNVLQSNKAHTYSEACFFTGLMTLAVFVAGIWLSSSFLGASVAKRKGWEAGKIRTLVAEHEKAGTLHKQLWPNYREPGLPNKADTVVTSRSSAKAKVAAKTAQDTALKLKIALPETPDDVQQQLISAQRTGLTLHLAAVSEAVMFKEDVASALIGTRVDHWVDVQRAEDLKRDPIVYVVQGSAVAVLAQFGDFPIEHAVMKEVLNSVQLA